MPNFLDLPSLGNSKPDFGSPSTRPGSPSSGLVGGALAGGAAAEFLHDFPNPLLPATGLAGGALANTFPDRPSGGSKPAEEQKVGAKDRPGTGRPERLGERPDAGRQGQPGVRPSRPSNTELAKHLPNRISNSAQSRQWRESSRNDVGDFIRTHPGAIHNWFEENWWSTSGIYYPYYPGFDPWGAAAWTGLNGWVDPNSSNPIYYNYGDNVYYQDGSVYYGDQPVATEEDYAKQAEAIATSMPETKPAAKDWMPLGLYAITSDGEPTGAEPTMFLQLAVSKQGVLSGTLQNTATNTVQAIEGMVDKQSQRAAFTAVDKARPLMETGIGNLTQDTAVALVHFADGTTQQCLLVRVSKPDDEPGNKPEKSASPAKS